MVTGKQKINKKNPKEQNKTKNLAILKRGNSCFKNIVEPFFVAFVLFNIF